MKQLQITKLDFIVTIIMAIFCAYMVIDVFDDNFMIGVFGLICFFIGLVTEKIK